MANLENPIDIDGGESTESGLLLVDLSLKSIACDQGAAAILKCQGESGIVRDPASSVPSEVLDVIRSRKPGDLSVVRTHVHIGDSEYLCRTYLLEPHSSLFKQQVVVVHLEKISFATDSIFECAADYHLTLREAEVLRGVSLGLATKDLATRLNISPNTVKSFLRLIMVKMGVTTRAEMFARILESRSASGDGSDPVDPDKPGRSNAGPAKNSGRRQAARSG